MNVKIKILHKKLIYKQIKLKAILKSYQQLKVNIKILLLSTNHIQNYNPLMKVYHNSSLILLQASSVSFEKSMT
jgi:hypothetical protein